MTSYTVIYRTGGTERCEWKKCLPVLSFEEACEQRASIERMGYKALIHKTKHLEAIGLPEGW